MKKAYYVIEYHSRGGKFQEEDFIGTRAECRARCREIQRSENCGTAIVFKRYMPDN